MTLYVDTKIKKHFRKFMLQKGLWNTFLVNVQKDFERDAEANEITPEELFNEIGPSSYVSAAFDWGKTKEGGAFWGNISNDWVMEYEEVFDVY